MVVLFGLNALAHENEQPFKGCAFETIHIHKLVEAFRDAVKGYEKRLEGAQQEVNAQCSKDDALSSEPEGVAAFMDRELIARISIGGLCQVEEKTEQEQEV